MTTPKPTSKELLRLCAGVLEMGGFGPSSHGIASTDACILARALQEMLQPSPARGVAALPLGTEVVYRPCGRFPEWERGGPYYFAGMVINVRTGRPSIWIADRWPVTSNGDLTDGFEVEEWDAKPSHAPKPTPQEPGPWGLNTCPKCEIGPSRAAGACLYAPEHPAFDSCPMRSPSPQAAAVTREEIINVLKSCDGPRVGSPEALADPIRAQRWEASRWDAAATRADALQAQFVVLRKPQGGG